MKILRLSIVASVVALASCDAGLPSENATNDFIPSGFAAPLSAEEYDSLSSTQKYQVASKAAAAVYKGIPVEDFFDLSAGLANPTLSSTASTYLQTFRSSINNELDNATVAQIQETLLGLDENGNPDPDLQKYNFSNDGKPKEEPYALIAEYPASRTSFIAAISLFLSNTIMFTCAEEMESTNPNDCQKTYSFLVEQITNRVGIRQIIRSYMPSIMNWRIGRSGQNVGVEGLEEFLGLFDRAEDADRVGIACQDVILLPEDQNYELSSTSFPNTEPQVILQEDTNGDGIGDSGGFFITRCDDFYNVVSGHPLLLPRVCEVVVNYMMAARSTDDRLAMCESLVNSGMNTFEDLFKGIIFSREYLMNTERVKGFDEFLLPTLQALQWDSRTNSGSIDERVWRNMASDVNNPLYMGDMAWHTMTLKIGRVPEVPTDALSFANFHKAARENVLMNTGAYRGRRRDVNGQDVYLPGLFFMSDEVLDPTLDGDDTEDDAVKPDIAAMSPADFIHYLFLTVLQRQATAEELNGLLVDPGSPILVNNHLDQDADGNDIIRNFRQDDVASIVFDYISRLAETYYVKAVN